MGNGISRRLRIHVRADQKGEEIHNFWNHIHFHPTDAIEDEWGQAILDQAGRDKAAGYVRIYAMLEDVVGRDEEGQLCYDFQATDERIDYLTEKGFRLLICFNFLPVAIAWKPDAMSWLARYKNKHINTSKPKDYREWQEVCRVYTEHLRQRYGDTQLSKWYFHCWNEPDFPEYFLSDVPREGHMEEVAEEYCKLYDHFVKGVESSCSLVRVGGPSAALSDEFIRLFLTHVKKGVNWADHGIGTRIDFLSVHTYGAFPKDLAGGRPIRVEDTYRRVKELESIAEQCGFQNLEMVVDEWGLSTEGFTSAKQCPVLEFRNTEKYGAAYAHLIRYYITRQAPVKMQMICLSGQHNLTGEFHGYRSFFTLHGFPKPIYNAYAMCAKLGDHMLEGGIGREGRDDMTQETTVCDSDGSVFGVLPTSDEKGRIAVLIYGFQPNLSVRTSMVREGRGRLVSLEIQGVWGTYQIRHYRIDRDNCNSYEAWKRLGKPEHPDQNMTEEIRREGKLKLWYPKESRELNGTWRQEIVMYEDSMSLIELEP